MVSEIMEPLEAEDIPAAPAEPEPPVKAKPKRRARLIGSLAALLVAGAAAGGYFIFQQGSAVSVAASTNAVDSYVEVPAMTVNLRTPDGQTRFLKLRFIIVATDPVHSEAIRTKIPLILDALQPFLRELRPEDLNGSAAVFRVKEEMMVRAHQAFGKDVVRDILIQDLVQQ